jgi:hypothetical protein
VRYLRKAVPEAALAWTAPAAARQSPAANDAQTIGRTLVMTFETCE